MVTRFFSLLFLVISFCAYSQSEDYAADFEMEMVDGSASRLFDYKGEVIYLSIWASWCKPCINNFEKYRDVRDSLQSMGVTLLNISIDSEPVKWRKAVNRLNIQGVHGITSKEALFQNYDISSIPYYEIISKSGTIVYLSDQANRDIFQEFSNWIRE